MKKYLRNIYYKVININLIKILIYPISILFIILFISLPLIINTSPSISIDEINVKIKKLNQEIILLKKIKKEIPAKVNINFVDKKFVKLKSEIKEKSVFNAFPILFNLLNLTKEQKKEILLVLSKWKKNKKLNKKLNENFDFICHTLNARDEIYKILNKEQIKIYFCYMKYYGYDL